MTPGTRVVVIYPPECSGEIGSVIRIFAPPLFPADEDEVELLLDSERSKRSSGVWCTKNLVPIPLTATPDQIKALAGIVKAFRR